MDSPDVHTICVLEPFLAPSRLLVTPVVAFLTNPAKLDELEASANEVARIFDHPLQAFLDPTLVKDEALSEMGSEDWPYETEFQVCMLKVITLPSLIQLGNRARQMYKPHCTGLQCIVCIAFAAVLRQSKD
jgi:hypothetical protein